MIGLFTRLAVVPLIGIMIVAIATPRIPEITTLRGIGDGDLRGEMTGAGSHA